MKKALFIATASLLLACAEDPRAKLPKTGLYGTEISSDSTLTANDVYTLIKDTNDVNVVVSGTIANYCKGEGCWLTLKYQGSDYTNPACKNKKNCDLFVEVENKAFVLPKDIDGKQALVQGRAVKEMIKGEEEVKILATGILIK